MRRGLGWEKQPRRGGLRRPASLAFNGFLRRTRASPTRRVIPSASKRSSRSCAGRRPVPSRSRKRASATEPDSSHSATARRERLVVGGAADHVSVADAHELALLLEMAGEFRVLGTDGLEARHLGRREKVARLLRALRKPGSASGDDEPPAAALEAEERHDRVRPRLRGRRNTGIERVRRRRARVQRLAELVQPGPGEDPAARLDQACPVRAEVGDGRGRHRLVDEALERAFLDERHPLRRRVSRRGGVEHRAAADRPAVAEDDRSPRAATTGVREPQLRPALADPHDPGRVLAGPVVDDWTWRPSATGSSSSSSTSRR